MSTSERRVALTLLAHPDDAEILCTGTLIRLRKLGWQIHIATMTAGDCGSTTIGAEEISRIRLGEARAAAASIGGTYHCVGEMDVHIVYDKPTIDKVISLFRRVAPTLVFTHALRDYMPDHEVSAMLARNATQIYGAPNVSNEPLVDGLKTCGIPHLYYCDPIDGIGPTGEPVTPSTIIDVHAELDAKAAALACHASQRDWLRQHQGTDEYIDAMKRHAARRGSLIQSPAAEAFVQHRSYAYPQDDLLARLLPKES
jgi:LmbE family N-acetylglucosaminyl deacetylase